MTSNQSYDRVLNLPTKRNHSPGRVRGGAQQRQRNHQLLAARFAAASMRAVLTSLRRAPAPALSNSRKTLSRGTQTLSRGTQTAHLQCNPRVDKIVREGEPRPVEHRVTALLVDQSRSARVLLCKLSHVEEAAIQRRARRAARTHDAHPALLRRRVQAAHVGVAPVILRPRARACRCATSGFGFVFPPHTHTRVRPIICHAGHSWAAHSSVLAEQGANFRDLFP